MKPPLRPAQNKPLTWENAERAHRSADGPGACAGRMREDVTGIRHRPSRSAETAPLFSNAAFTQHPQPAGDIVMTDSHVMR